jgi:plasmid replication initiation protein
VQQLDQLTDRERNRLTAIEDIAGAGKALYATLTTEQRAIADRKLVLPVRPLAAGVVLPE